MPIKGLRLREYAGIADWTDDNVKVGGAYEPKDGKITAVSNFVGQTGEDATVRKANFEESLGWYAGITSDMFG